MPALAPPALAPHLVALVLLAVCPMRAARAQTLSVTRNNTPILERCGEAVRVLALLPAGHEVALRFAIAGTSQRCYAVWTRLAGETFSGYIDRDAVEGAGAFERTLREASAARLVEEAIRTIRVPAEPSAAIEPSAGSPVEVGAAVRLAIFELNAGRPSEVERILANARPPSQSREAALLRAQALLQLTRPREALEIVRPALAAQPRDADLLAVAGLSAYLADEPGQARSYLRQSLDQSPNGGIEKILLKLEKEVEADESTHTAYGARFVLRYERSRLPPETSRRLLELFEAEANRISLELGCPLPSRQPVILQSVENYRSTTGTAAWSAGHYDGRIRIAVPLQADAAPHARQIFAHEYVHSCLARMARWPAWFQEGMAQRLSGETAPATGPLTPRTTAARRAWPALRDLEADWSRLSEEQAAAAYSVSLAAVNLLYERLHPAGIRNLLGSPGRLAELSGMLQSELRASLGR